MVHQSCSYLKLKGSTYYFSRRVPKSLQKHFKTDRVEVCLHTPQQSSAVLQAQVLASELEDHWYILRGRGLSSESIGRNLTSIRAIVNFVSKEEGLQPPLAFSGVYLGEPTRKTDRYVPTATELRLQSHPAGLKKIYSDKTQFHLTKSIFSQTICTLASNR